MWSKYKYLIAYIAPIFGFLGLYYRGPWSLGAVYIGFICLPLLETFLPQRKDQPTFNEDKPSLIHDILLYLNIPILYSAIAYFIYVLDTVDMNWGIRTMLILNLGLMMGVQGINVAHEIGHRKGKINTFLSQLLLLPSLYMHFSDVHNLWHHKYVSTDKDPSSAYKNESLYAFWIRSISGVWLKAIEIERNRLQRLGKGFFTIENRFLLRLCLQAIYIISIAYFFGTTILISLLGAAVMSILLLESINYIEHYGLRRAKRADNTYELVDLKHSWNSDQELGRIFLYELTRHSDHHYKASRNYQHLRSFEQSPQLPFGYPASIILAFVPPLWFKIMNQRIS